jgi:large conductance mechanosensitive channel
MGFLEEFKKFALKGNMLDMAIGIIVGAAFGGVVNSLVQDILMPPLGLVLGGVDFSSLYVNLSGGRYASLADAQAAGAATINYGVFLNAVMNFMIVALAMFMLVRAFNRLAEGRKRAEAAAPMSTKDCPHCAMSIPVAAKRCPHCTSEL